MKPPISASPRSCIGRGSRPHVRRSRPELREPLRGLRNWPTGVGLIVDLHVEHLTCGRLHLFRRLTVEMLVVLLGIRTRAMNDAVTVVWRSIERVKLQWGRTRIDDVVLGASRNEHSEAGADRTADAVENSLPQILPLRGKTGQACEPPCQSLQQDVAT